MRRTLRLALTLIVLPVAGCGPSSAGGRIPVVAAENFYGSILEQVGGARVEVTSIVKDPAVDPHEYSGRVTDTEAVAGARLVVVNGAGYDAFMDRLLGATASSQRTVVRVDRLVAAGAGANPHLWYDPRAAAAVARAAADRLAAIDPRHAASYTSRARRFVASLAPLDVEIASLHRRFAGVPFACTERVAGRLTDRIGLDSLTPMAFAKADENGTDPPPQSVATMRALVTGHRIRLLLYNTQASSQPAATIRALARAEGIPVVGVSETSPPGVTYQRWQLAQMRAIDRALS